MKGRGKVLLFLVVIMVVVATYAIEYQLHAREVNFSNDSMASKDLQDAIDELYKSVNDGCYVGYEKDIETDGTYLCNKKSEGTISDNTFDAINVKYNNSTSNLSASNIKEAIEEIIGDIPSCDSDHYKMNETTTKYECHHKCENVIYRDGTVCSVTYQQQSGTLNKLAYSTVDSNYACPDKNETSGGSACNGAEDACASGRTYDSPSCGGYGGCSYSSGGRVRTCTHKYYSNAISGYLCSTGSSYSDVLHNCSWVRITTYDGTCYPDCFDRFGRGSGIGCTHGAAPRYDWDNIGEVCFHYQ